jgi:hypothetical protein
MPRLSRKALNFGALKQIEPRIDSAGIQPTRKDKGSHTPGTDAQQ